MAAPVFRNLPQPDLVVVVVALVAALVSGAGLADLRPYHLNCLASQNRLFLGDPGAGIQPRPVTCELRFFVSQTTGYLQLSAAQTVSSASLDPLTSDTSDITGADQIPVSDRSVVQCHPASSTLVLEGARRCRFSLWQLSPAYKGVALRLTSGPQTTTYLFHYASLPPGARQIPR